MKTSERERLRLQRKRRVRLKVQKQKSRPRLTVFRSTKHIYAQIVDDNEGRTLVTMSSLSKNFKEQMKTGGEPQSGNAGRFTDRGVGGGQRY